MTCCFVISALVACDVYNNANMHAVGYTHVVLGKTVTVICNEYAAKTNGLKKDDVHDNLSKCLLATLAVKFPPVLKLAPSIRTTAGWVVNWVSDYERTQVAGGGGSGDPSGGGDVAFTHSGSADGPTSSFSADELLSLSELLASKQAGQAASAS